MRHISRPHRRSLTAEFYQSKPPNCAAIADEHALGRRKDPDRLECCELPRAGRQSLCATTENAAARPACEACRPVWHGVAADDLSAPLPPARAALRARVRAINSRCARNWCSAGPSSVSVGNKPCSFGGNTGPQRCAGPSAITSGLSGCLPNAPLGAKASTVVDGAGDGNADQKNAWPRGLSRSRAGYSPTAGCGNKDRGKIDRVGGSGKARPGLPVSFFRSGRPACHRHGGPPQSRHPRHHATAPELLIGEEAPHVRLTGFRYQPR